MGETANGAMGRRDKGQGEKLGAPIRRFA